MLLAKAKDGETGEIVRTRRGFRSLARAGNKAQETFLVQVVLQTLRKGKKTTLVLAIPHTISKISIDSSCKP